MAGTFLKGKVDGRQSIYKIWRAKMANDGGPKMANDGGPKMANDGGPKMANDGRGLNHS